MANEVSKFRISQDDQIKQINDRYRQRKKDLIETSEDKLKQLREKYNSEEQKLRRHGEATVNHIRKSNDERIDNIKAKIGRASCRERV